MVNTFRRRFNAVAAAATLLAALAPQVAWSSESVKFDAQAFRAAQAAGKPVLVDVFANW